MDFNFNGKRILVTGAGRGIGRELCKKLSKKCNARVIALSRTKIHLNSLKSEVPSIEIIAVDIADWTATTDAVEKIGHVDMLVNNAGLGGPGPYFGQNTEEYFDSLVAVNLKGPLNISQIVANEMKAKGTGGVIVNVSSALAKKAFPTFSVYSATKAALDQMTRVMAVELGSHKIRVCTVNPTLVRTEMVADLIGNEEALAKSKSTIPIGNICEPEEVIDAIIYLLSDRAGMVHGGNLFLDGGQTL